MVHLNEFTSIFREFGPVELIVGNKDIAMIHVGSGLQRDLPLLKLQPMDKNYPTVEDIMAVIDDCAPCSISVRRPPGGVEAAEERFPG